MLGGKPENVRNINCSNSRNNLPLKPGSATLPFFGVQPVILDNEGNDHINGAFEETYV